RVVVRTQGDRGAAPRIAEMRELEPRLQFIDGARQRRAEGHGAFEEVLDLRHEADDLDVQWTRLSGEAVALMTRQVILAEDEERAAVEDVEKRAGEAIDVDRRSLPRRETIEGRVQGAVTTLEHRVVCPLV